MTRTAPDVGLDVHFGTTPPALTVAGEIDMLTAPLLSCALLGFIDHQPTFVLDVSRVTFIDGRGAGALADATVRARIGGGRVIVRGASTFTLRVLALTGTIDLVELDDGTGRVASDVDLAVADTAGARVELDPTVRVGSTSTIDLVDTSLDLVTSLADATFPHHAGTSITLERHGQLVTVAATTEDVLAVDHHQYAVGQGPCLDAKAQDRWFYAASLATETRWPAMVPVALERGVRSILSAPLRASGRALGSLNLYSSIDAAFGSAERHLAGLFAEHASHILAIADDDSSREQWDARFAAALRARRTIHRAQGIVMAHLGIGADDASAQLLQDARNQRVPLATHAAEIVERLLDDQQPGDDPTSH